MRTVFLFFILFYFSLAAFSQDKKMLFVHAENGLIMRKEPATTGEKLLTLPYGSKIQLLSEEKFGKLTEVKELSNWNISGQWLYVTFNGQDGYVFEGFVSWLPASQNKTNERFEKYFLEEIGVISGKYDFKKTKITEEFKVETVCGFSQNLNFGITYSENDCNEAGRTVKIFFKKTLVLQRLT